MRSVKGDAGLSSRDRVRRGSARERKEIRVSYRHFRPSDNLYRLGRFEGLKEAAGLPRIAE